MTSTDFSQIISNLIGEAPAGLEWLSYFGSWLLVFFGLGSVLIIILKILKLFDRN